MSKESKVASGLQRESAALSAHGMLQRKCDCGQHTGGGECEECKKKKGILQRQSSTLTAPAVAPPIVHEVLRSPGRPLDSETRDFVESRFGRDFSSVRVHTGAQAEESTRAVNASAYAVAHNVVFGDGKYSPNTMTGRKLLLHELTHVVQQEDKPASAEAQLSIGPFDSPAELEADRVAHMIGCDDSGAGFQTTRRDELSRESRNQAVGSSPPLRTRLVQRETPSPQKEQASDQANDRTTLTTLPGYSQKGDTCGAASLVSALMIWDRDKRDPKAPSTAVESACNIILTYLVQHKTKTINGWNDKKLNGQNLYDLSVSAITDIRDAAKVPGATISELQCQLIAGTLYLLYVDAGKGGLSAAEISQIQRSLGLESGRSEGIQSFAEIFGSSILKGLKEGQIAQIGWYVKTSKPNAQGAVNLTHHAFLIGRLRDGTWFLSDQGPTPTFELKAGDLGTLQQLITTASRTGSYWVYTGSISEMKLVVVGAWTGVRLLTDAASVEKKETAIVPSGTFLAEVDAGALTIGDKIYAGDFVSRHYSLSDAKSVDTSTYGGLIVEMPQGVFSYYRTNLLSSEDNLKVTDIDRDDSTDGLLMGPRFFHAWLRLCTKDQCRVSLLSVY